MSSCLTMYVDSDDWLEYYKRQVVTAKKGHTCLECGQTILAGARYERATGYNTEYRDWEVYKTCAACMNVRDTLICSGGDYQHGELWMFLDTRVDELDQKLIRKLSTRGRQAWNDWLKRDKDWWRCYNGRREAS